MNELKLNNLQGIYSSINVRGIASDCHQDVRTIVLRNTPRDTASDYTTELFIGNDGGVYKSTNDADVCDYKSNGLSTTQFYHFERKNNNNSIWGGAQDNGILEHETNGNYSLYSTGDGYDMMTDHDYNVSNGEGNDQFYTVNEGIRRYSFLNP